MEILLFYCAERVEYLLFIKNILRKGQCSLLTCTTLSSFLLERIMIRLQSYCPVLIVNQVNEPHDYDFSEEFIFILTRLKSISKLDN